MFRPLITGPSAAPSHLVFPAGQPGQEFADPLPCLRRGRLCTAALLPRHRLPVASSLAQPQLASPQPPSRGFYESSGSKFQPFEFPGPAEKGVILGLCQDSARSK